MSKRTPAWVQEARELCRNRDIEIAGLGPDTLLVKITSPDHAFRVASQLEPLGFVPIDDHDDAESGLLLLSRNPADTRAKQRKRSTAVDITRRPMIERIAPVLEASFSIFGFWIASEKAQPASWFFAALASVLMIIAMRDGGRFWGWKLQISADALGVRRNFRWSSIAWMTIHAVESVSAGGRNQEAVILTLATNATLSLGIFSYPFARALRDGVRDEITHRSTLPSATDPDAMTST